MRPVRIVVGAPPGGGYDIVARLMGQWLSDRLGQQFIIDNRPGAGGNVGTETVVRAPADGYTLLLVGAPNAINATLYQRLNFNFIRDIAPLAGMQRPDADCIDDAWAYEGYAGRLGGIYIVTFEGDGDTDYRESGNETSEVTLSRRRDVLPQFPWPPPAPSTFYVLPDSLLQESAASFESQLILLIPEDLRRTRSYVYL
jgi:hypothetical protein